MWCVVMNQKPRESIGFVGEPVTATTVNSNELPTLGPDGFLIPKRQQQKM